MMGPHEQPQGNSVQASMAAKVEKKVRRVMKKCSLAPLLPVEIVLHPSWWHAHAGITFDEDFFYHPAKRVESERRMEAVLHECFGAHGLGADRNRDLPMIGAVHNAAGYLLQEMLGCGIRYHADAAPDVLPAGRDRLTVNPEAAFDSGAFRRYQQLCEALRTRYGYVRGDINWSGVLNIALDLRGHNLFLDMSDSPDTVRAGLQQIAGVIGRFAAGMQAETGTSSISVNRTVRHFTRPVFLHSECSNTMIAADDYERFLLPIDVAWSRQHRPFGIHHCGRDPHRFAASYAKVPHLDFLDVGWGGDVRTLRAHLPHTFLNLRLDPVQLVTWTPAQIRETIVRLVADSADPWRTGICCINLDQRATDAQINAIFETVEDLRAANPAPQK
jgi:hypothetical protein